MIEVFYPEVASKIRQLEDEALRFDWRASGATARPNCYWGRRDERENPDQLDFLPMCVGCMQEGEDG